MKKKINGLRDLNNPEKIKALLLNTGHMVELRNHQGFQTTGKTIQLWERDRNGHVYKVQHWKNSTVERVFR